MKDEIPDLKDYADRLRDEINAAGWSVVDTKDGYELKPL